MPKIQRALISVTDKSGINELAVPLSRFGVEILSTGGTAKALSQAGIKIREVSDFTGFPEMLDGRVKTLHPKIHGGILGIRSRPEHVKAMEEHGIVPIDMVVVNLYAFEKTVSRPNCHPGGRHRKHRYWRSDPAEGICKELSIRHGHHGSSGLPRNNQGNGSIRGIGIG